MTHARWKSKRLLAVVSFPSKCSVRPGENTARRVPLTLKNIHAKVQKSTYKENNNENKFMRLENSPPLPRNFSNGPSLNIMIDSLSKGGIKCSNMFLLCNWMFSQYSSPISTSTRKMEKSGRVEKTDPHSADYPLTPLRGLLYGLVRGLPCGLP